MINQVLLCGNPNSGKTTIFNLLTNEHQRTGNWSGVTVEKKTAFLILQNHKIQVTDLPGIYSIDSFSMEEEITAHTILNCKYALLVHVIDGCRLERSLYLTLQLLELNLPLLLVISMVDEMEKNKISIDITELSKKLGIPVILFSPKNKSSIELLKKFMLNPPIASHTSQIYNSNFKNHNVHSKNITMDLTQARYRFIDRLLYECHFIKPSKNEKKEPWLDKLCLGRIGAYPIFFIIIFTVFFISFGPLGQKMKNIMQEVIIISQNHLLDVMLGLNAPSWCIILLTQIVIGGVGTVLCFLPQIIILFFCLSFLEDCGYLARASFIMDFFFSKIGLTGKSFIPLFMGLGCTTSSIMAARATSSKKERKILTHIAPFISCSAKLPVYGLFASVFFQKNQEWVIISLYLLGMIVAICYAAYLSSDINEHSKTIFIMEMPPYRFPKLIDLLLHTAQQCYGYLWKIGTLIFSMNILIWILQNITFDLHLANTLNESILASIGKTLSSLFIPLGFNDWRQVTALLAGVTAKESIISVLGILYGTSPASQLESCLYMHFTKASAYSFMVFSLLYMPCISSFSCLCKEVGGFLRGIKVILIQNIIAYIIAFLSYTFIRLIEVLLG